MPASGRHLRSPEAAQAAVDDSQLRANLRRATRTIRPNGTGSWPSSRTSRNCGAARAAIKDDALGRLNDSLGQLEEQVTARGGHVHFARHAADANRVVTRLVRETGADEVVKVKSMTTAEIGLNEALQAAGIRASETDLAELIVQLGADLPSHIVVPAIHRNRAEIRSTTPRAHGRPRSGRPRRDERRPGPTGRRGKSPSA